MAVAPPAGMTLTLEHVHLRLAAFDLAVDAVLDAPVTGIFGASGAGKTSLLEVIAGIRREHSGRVRLGERVLADAAAKLFVPPEARAVGYVPQDGALFPHLSVRQNLGYGAPRAQASAAPGLTLEHVVEVLGIDALLDRAPATLSGGEKQRVALGRALLAAPRVLLVDEPLAGLEAPLRERLRRDLRRIRAEFSIPMVYVSHAADEIVGLCDEVLVLDRGRLVRRGPPAELFAASPDPHYMLRPE